MRKSLVVLTLGLAFSCSVFAQSKDKEEAKDSTYKFTMVKELKYTPVKNQYRSGTCWSFSGTSFLESELLRMGKGEYDLSEMFVVRNSYKDKADHYVRMHGSTNFAGGGGFPDVINSLKYYGAVPEEAYPGLLAGEKGHVHGEMDAVLRAMADAVIKNNNKQLSPVWKKAFDGVLDAYLGDYPKSFVYKGKSYTPQSFAKELGINPDDYVEIGSYTHHPFYTKFVLEIPDNWVWADVYNVPLEDFEKIMDYSIDKGYSIAWASDVSEKGFAWKKGVAVVPEKDVNDLSDLEKGKWSKLSDKEKDEQLFNGKEKVISQEMRQLAFDNYNTTDDHGMHIVGIAKDQWGNKYYYTKNSWGSDNHEYKGLFYASRAFVLLKSTSIMVNKKAIPPDIAKKLGII
ncbi:MAG: C1 family peptidase [Bacteroidota bacterium]|nr:C1 family peptidase [Bacteroidota bacterium]